MEYSEVPSPLNGETRLFLSKAVMVLTVILFSFSVLPGDAFCLGIENRTTVVDDAGRRVTVQEDRPFKRIISLYGAHTENLFALGMASRIIGVSRNEVYPPEAKAKKVFSFHDDPEKFLAARPDLVLIRPMIDRGYPDLVKRLEKSGIRVLSLQPSSLEEMYVYWNILGLLGGVPGLSHTMVDAFQGAVVKFKGLTQGVKNKKRVYFESIHSRMKTFVPGSLSIFILETAGGINVAKDAVSSRGTNIAIYGKERILSHGDEIDVFLAQKGRMNNVTREIIKNEPGFQIIRGVREGQIFLIDEMIVSRPSFRLLRGINEVGQMLYPEIFGKKAKMILNSSFGVIPGPAQLNQVTVNPKVECLTKQ